MALAERELSVPIVSEQGEYPFRVTKDQFYRMADLGWFAGKRVELIDGVIYEKTSPMSDRHAAAILGISDFLSDIFRPGHVISVQIPVNASTSSEPEPDIAILKGRARDYKKKPQSAVLVVEVSLSSLHFDRKKADLYARAGVAEYWIVNMDDDCLEVYRAPTGEREQPGTGVYAEQTVLRRGDTIAPLAAPQTVIPVDEMLE